MLGPIRSTACGNGFRICEPPGIGLNSFRRASGWAASPQAPPGAWPAATAGHAVAGNESAGHNLRPEGVFYPRRTSVDRNVANKEVRDESGYEDPAGPT